LKRDGFRASARVYRVLLYLYPKELRTGFGDAMVQELIDSLTEARQLDPIAPMYGLRTLEEVGATSRSRSCCPMIP